MSQFKMDLKSENSTIIKLKIFMKLEKDNKTKKSVVKSKFGWKNIFGCRRRMDCCKY